MLKSFLFCCLSAAMLLGPNLFGKPNSTASFHFKMRRGEALQGDTKAQYDLGVFYLTGEQGVEKDLDQAIYWLDRKSVV